MAYKKTMALLLTLLEDPTASEPSDDAVATAEKVYELEKTLTEAHMTKTENRDPPETYNRMTMDELIQLGDGAFDFGSYFEAATGKTVKGKMDLDVTIINFAPTQPFLNHTYTIIR